MLGGPDGGNGGNGWCVDQGADTLVDYRRQSATANGMAATNGDNVVAGAAGTGSPTTGEQIADP